jgi:hypothetical protein
LGAVAIDESGMSSSLSTVTITVTAAANQTTPPPSPADTLAPARLVFTPSVDDGTLVEYYSVEIYQLGGAELVASRYLGKPAAANGEISVDLTEFVASLPPGTYVAVVTAYGPGGSTSSQPSPPFTK